MPNFGANGALTKEDASRYSETLESNAIKEKSEGGYTITRPRYKQKRRRIFETGFTNLTDAEKAELQDFEESVGATIEPFYWRNPRTQQLHLVQLIEPMKFSYAGFGKSARWNVHGIKLREV